MSGYQKALEQMWRDRCTVYHRVKVTDPATGLTDFVEQPLLEEEPCKLSFETLGENGGDHVATVSQTVKLFLRASAVIPAGCRIVVRRENEPQRQWCYAKSGEAGVFSHHQELFLVPFERYA